MVNDFDYPPDSIEAARIKIIKPLASGFYGTVYKGIYYEPSENDVYSKEKQKYIKLCGNIKDVAVKKLKPEEFNPTLARRELLAGTINHSHIVKIFGNYTEINENNPNEKVFCFVMEYCAGGTIAELLTEERNGKVTITLGAKLCIAYDITRAMHNLHIRKFIHRDLKSENCMIKTKITKNHIDDVDIRKSVVKIIDFGLLRDFKEIVESLKRKADSKASTLKKNFQYNDNSSFSYSVNTNDSAMLPPEVGNNNNNNNNIDNQKIQQIDSKSLTFEEIAGGVNLTMTVGTFSNNPPEMLLGRQDFNKNSDNGNTDKNELYNSVIANVEVIVMSKNCSMKQSFSTEKHVENNTSLWNSTDVNLQSMVSPQSGNLLNDEETNFVNIIEDKQSSDNKSHLKRSSKIMLCSQNNTFNLTGKEFIETLISAIEINKTRMKSTLQSTEETGDSSSISSNDIKNLISRNTSSGINTASMPISVAKKILPSNVLPPFSPQITISASVLDSVAGINDDSRNVVFNCSSESPSSDLDISKIENNCIVSDSAISPENRSKIEIKNQTKDPVLTINNKSDNETVMNIGMAFSPCSTTGTVIHTKKQVTQYVEDLNEIDLSKPYAESTPIMIDKQGQINKVKNNILYVKKRNSFDPLISPNQIDLNQDINITDNIPITIENDNEEEKFKNLFTSSYNTSDYGTKFENYINEENKEEEEEQNVTEKAKLPYNEKIDVFNFGMILINLFNRGLDLDVEEIRNPDTFEIKSDVIIKELRKNNVNDLLIAIILSCFESEPCNRPSFRMLKRVFRWLLKENARNEAIKLDSQSKR